MQRYLRPSRLSLRIKLVLSYLLVTLGAILILTVVVSLAIQNYFASAQLDQLRAKAEYQAQQIGQSYATAGNWDEVPATSRYSLDLMVIVDVNGVPVRGIPQLLQVSDSIGTVLKQSVQQALQGQEAEGRIQFSVRNQAFSGLYMSVPIRYNGEANGQIVGAMLLTEQEQYPNGSPPNQFLTNVNWAILISGIAVMLIVILFSLVMARRLTRPVEALTAAAEQMKRGKYAQRVAVPATQDELGQLALTFNSMADTIESDVNELRQQDQIRRELIANIAHDLATPLTAIQGFSEALADDLISKPDARHETAQLIGREVQRLRRLVADMQQMSSLESGRIQLDLAPLDLHSLVVETLSVIEPECEEAGIILSNKLDEATPLVLADSDRITQVLLNLLDNARRHTHEGGTITVTAEPEGKMLRVSISDTGVGIDSADLPHIFERFYRADRSRTGATGGSGLGLSIVKAIITAHGGTVCADSTPGQGTRISFSLPLAQ